MSPWRSQLRRASLAVIVVPLLLAHPLSAQRPASAVTDGLGREVELRELPVRRVVSLVPSATDLLVRLGGTDHLVGRTRYDSARAVRDVADVGEPLMPSLEMLVRLRPDLVIAWPDVRRRGRGARLEKLVPAVYFVETSSVADVDELIGDLGALLGLEEAADSLRRALECQLDEVVRAVAGRPTVSVVHLVWPDPLFVAGPGSYLDSLMHVAGGRNAFGDAASPWPQVSLEALISASPDVVLLGGEAGTEVWGTLTDRSAWRSLEAAREERVHRLSPDLFHRPGPDLGRAASRLARLLHPDVDLPDPGVCVPGPDVPDRGPRGRAEGGPWTP